MFSYYTSIIFLSLLALGVLSILIQENDRLSKTDKRLLELTYALIAVSALAEWTGVQLNGRTDIPKWALICAKTVDFTLTPLAGGALVIQIRLKNRWRNALLGILAFNVVFQVVSLFTGWMIVVDDAHRYTHGPLYGLYMGVCLAIIGLVIIEFVLYGRAFRRQNRWSLYAVMLLVVVGVAMQEATPSDIRTSYIALTLGAALMFIHYTEFLQLAMDDTVSEQQLQLDTDALTGLFSRHAYSRTLKTLDAAGALPRDLAAFTIDINGLKQVNDSLGHEAGDELIRGAAACITKAIGVGRSCFRTGGDEFVVLTPMSREEADDALGWMYEEARRWRGERVKTLSLSAGYALVCDHDSLTAEALVRESDTAMYEAKAAYYREAGRDRRRRRPRKD
ncbi:MAG: GGDEF domain-containing protein [Clostridia bacterium]|nr:GGDEF domain-containing protein [Clostridia bacterium]